MTQQAQQRESLGSGRLRGKVALVTAAEWGMGRAIAVLFAHEGADIVVVHARRRDETEITRRLVEKAGARCLALEGDVANDRFCRRIVDHTLDAFGSLDALTNVAEVRIPARRTPLGSTVAASKRALCGYWNLCRAAIPLMETGGVVLNGIVRIGVGEATFPNREDMLELSRAMSDSLRLGGIRMRTVVSDSLYDTRCAQPVSPAHEFLKIAVERRSLRGLASIRSAPPAAPVAAGQIDP